MDGNWSHWSPFTSCSAGCIKTRNRVCNNPPPSKVGGAKCSGGNGMKQVQTAKCNPKYCGKLLTIIHVVTNFYLCIIYSYIANQGFCLKYSVRKRFVSERPETEL